MELLRRLFDNKFAPLLIVLVVGLVLFFVTRGEGGEAGEKKSGYARMGEAVAFGENYYLWVASAELYATDGEGDPWDSDKSAPDVLYTVRWRENRIYESELRPDVLLAIWEPWRMGADIEVNPLDAFKALFTSENANVEVAAKELLNVAELRPQLNDGDHVQLGFMDQDDWRSDDFIGQIDIDLKQMKIGTNELSFQKGPKQAIKRVEVVVVPTVDAVVFLKETYLGAL